MLAVSGRLLTETRDIDSLGRWEEKSLMLLLPGTPAPGARTMMDRILPDTTSLLEDFGGWRIVAGITTMPAEDIARRQDFLEKARGALAKAKEKATGESSVTALWGARRIIPAPWRKPGVFTIANPGGPVWWRAPAVPDPHNTVLRLGKANACSSGRSGYVRLKRRWPRGATRRPWNWPPILWSPSTAGPSRS